MQPAAGRVLALLLLVYCNGAVVRDTLQALPLPRQLRMQESPAVRIVDASSLAALKAITLSDLTGPVLVTLTNSPEAAEKNLCDPTCPGGATVVILRAAEVWPGNLFKIRAFMAAAAAIPAATTILFTDCCDVWFKPRRFTRSLLTGKGGVTVFQRFAEETDAGASTHLAGAEIVMAATRGFQMITGNRKGERRPLEARVRYRFWDHQPEEFPANARERAAGVPDTCNKTAGLCDQSKFGNAGLVMGRAGALARFYAETWDQCELCQEWEASEGVGVSLQNTSEQNEVIHSIIKTGFCTGKCAFDTDMALFHVTTGFLPEDYSIEADGHITLAMPGSVRQDVPAAVVHASGGKRVAADVMRKIVAELEPGRSDTFWAPKHTM